MFSLLFLGFVIGMRHALEADHLAAVASLASRSASLRQSVRHGTAWGIGHTLTLFLFGGLVLAMDSLVPQDFARTLEAVVGVMLVLLGADVIRRVIRQRIHYHAHRHGAENPHFHAHSHAGEGDHAHSDHAHAHDRDFPLRALLVGLVHGMAGSAALILLTLETVESVALGIAYIALFGLGSIAGMALLSAVISLPLRFSARRLTWLHNGLQLSIGCLTLAIGSAVVWQSW
ncbi:MAG: urease accessory protein [Gammaproteobacteria bacterium]|nr:urease accessory protein [Gammaproteobacteria bacterium]